MALKDRFPVNKRKRIEETRTARPRCSGAWESRRHLCALTHTHGGAKVPDDTGGASPREAEDRGEPGSRSCGATGIATDTQGASRSHGGSKGCLGKKDKRCSPTNPRREDRERGALAEDVTRGHGRGRAGHARPCIRVPATPLFLPGTDPVATVGIGARFPVGRKGLRRTLTCRENPAPTPSGRAENAALQGGKRPSAAAHPVRLLTHALPPLSPRAFSRTNTEKAGHSSD